MKTLKLFTLSLTVLAFLAFTGPKETLTIDGDASEVKWTGYHIAKSYEHWGNVAVKSGSIDLSGGNITGGSIVIDMNSISNGDISDSKDNAKLVNHLKSDDFFDVANYPEATLNIKSSVKEEDIHKVTADLTIKGITKEISFDATSESAEENTVFEASLRIDRTDYEVMYGWSLENVILSNEFKLDILLRAN